MIEDPRINFAISKRGHNLGVNHMGFQVDSADELVSLHEQAANADISTVLEANAACCYAKSNKYWIQDPQGIAWETFHTLGGIPVYGEDNGAIALLSEGACCVPLATQPKDDITAACCVPNAKAPDSTAAACDEHGEGRTVQRVVPLHRQFGTQRDRGSPLERLGDRTVSSL